MKLGRYIVIFLGVLGGAWLAFGDTVSRRLGDVEIKTAREVDDNATPTWPVDPDFQKDVFTFARAQYVVEGRYRKGRERSGLGHTPNRWAIDFPACDLDISYRLQQMTSIKVDPDARVLKITDTNLFQYPFIYIVEPGRGFLTDEEVPVIRKYLLNGGFIMFDDFWGDAEWETFSEEMKRLFPEDKFPKQTIADLPLEHPVFHTVFDLKEQPQVPGIEWLKYYQSRGTTYEFKEDGAETVHYRGISDDKGRLMVLICHNTDLGDGWEREGDNQDYFRIFSEPKAFPMGINAIVYAMTH